MFAEFKKLTWLAVPLVLAQLAQNTMSLVDTIMVGKLGDDELAGMAIGSTTFFFTLLVFSGVLYAVSPLVANAIEPIKKTWFRELFGKDSGSQ